MVAFWTTLFRGKGSAKPGEIAFLKGAIPDAGLDSCSAMRNSLLAKVGFFYRGGITGCDTCRDAEAPRVRAL
jgi:hypothetical protein